MQPDKALIRKNSQPNTLGMTLMALALLGMSGCSTYFAVDNQQKLATANTVLSGTVSFAENSSAPIIVGLVDNTGSEPVLVDYFVSVGTGRFIFAVEPGSYQLAAFVDLDANGRYNDEPALPLSDTRPVTIQAGEIRRDQVLDIPDAGRFVSREFSMSEVVARDPGEQQRLSLYSLCAVGEVTSLDHERFARENAQAGMWKFYDFLLEHRCGVYFLQAYDADKIPVLFVHGISGTPLDFEAIIADLDTDRYQPWVFYYPSGATLSNTSALLLQLMYRLKLEYPFDDMHVVAHSMGGLVARDFVLLAAEAGRSIAIQSFTTISSPLGGMASAGSGVEHSPNVVSSWRGLDPEGEFLDALFYHEVDGRQVRRMIPDSIPYHMLFGFGGKSGDGIVAISSQLREEAQVEAESIRGFDEDHSSILSSPAAIEYLKGILAGQN
jgi:pimeloyl-ACP methyl ester carboxylesterase